MVTEDMDAGRWRASLAVWLKEAAGTQILDRLLGQGKPMGLEVQRRMEDLLGRDLSQVVIHDTRQAGAIAERLGAEAFTVGPRIFAAPDGFNPGTPRGLALLAHELAHVVQQTRPSPAPAVDASWRGEPTTPVAFEAPLTGQPRGLSSAPTAAMVQMQTTEASDAEPDAMETQARAAEEAVQGTAREPAGVGAVDPHRVAERVYRLMQEDLRLERERRAF
jgi:hypothetical protein